MARGEALAGLKLREEMQSNVATMERAVEDSSLADMRRDTAVAAERDAEAARLDAEIARGAAEAEQVSGRTCIDLLCKTIY